MGRWEGAWMASREAEQRDESHASWHWAEQCLSALRVPEGGSHILGCGWPSALSWQGIVKPEKRSDCQLIETILLPYRSDRLLSSCQGWRPQNFAEAIHCVAVVDTHFSFIEVKLSHSLSQLFWKTMLEALLNQGRWHLLLSYPQARYPIEERN